MHTHIYIHIHVYSEVRLTNLVVINATRPVLVCVLYFTVGRGQNGNACADKCIMSFWGSAAQRFRIVTIYDILLYYLCVCVYTIRVCCVYNIGVVNPSLSVVKTLRSLVTRGQHIIIHHMIYTTAVRSRWRQWRSAIINYSKQSVGRRPAGE